MTDDILCVGRSYDDICDDWQKFRRSTEINKCIADFADRLAPCGKILDVGCGTGYPVAQYLCERGFYVTGIDISAKMIEQADKLQLKNAVFLKRDILDYSTDTRYDGVIAFDSIWHIAKERQTDVYKKISYLMNTGAYLLFTHGKRDGETVGTMFNRRFYYSALDLDDLKVALSDAGLTVVDLVEDYKEQTTGERDLLVIARKI